MTLKKKRCSTQNGALPSFGVKINTLGERGPNFLRRSNVSRGNKTTVQLQNLLQPHRMTLPVKCLWQQQLFISDSYRFPNWLPMFTSLHPPVLTQTQQNGSKKVTWLCQVLHFQSFLGCFFLRFHFPFNFGWFHQPSSTRSTLSTLCLANVLCTLEELQCFHTTTKAFELGGLQGLPTA